MLINEAQRDALTEIVNIGTGRAAAALNEMVGHKVLIRVPWIEVITQKALDGKVTQKYGSDISLVRMAFFGEVSGEAAMIFPPDSSKALVRVLIGEESLPEEMGVLREGTLTEVGNIIINSVIGSVSNMMGAQFSFGLPSFSEGLASHVMLGVDNEEDAILVANTELSVDELEIEGVIVLFFSMGSFSAFLKKIDSDLLF